MSHEVTGELITYFYCLDCEKYDVLSVDMTKVTRKLAHTYQYDDNAGVFTCEQCGHINGCAHTNTYHVQYLINGGVATAAYGKNDVHRVHSQWNYGDYCPDCGLLQNALITNTFTVEMPHTYNADGLCTRCDHFCTHKGDAVKRVIQNEAYSPVDAISHEYSCDFTLPQECPYCGLKLGGSAIHEQESAPHSYQCPWRMRRMRL